MMVIRFKGGEDAIGDAGPVADQRVKKNAKPAYVAPQGNGRGAEAPTGLHAELPVPRDELKPDKLATASPSIGRPFAGGRMVPRADRGRT
jgi:hypothetical protein